jgi:ABC-type antimicrobial peptide transport system permease subunit
VAVVDESLARHYWPNESGVGKRIRHQGDTSSTAWMTIVGVVANVKHTGIDDPKTDLQVYEAFAQLTAWNNFLVVRSSVPPETLVPEIRRELAASDPNVPLYEVSTMQDVVDQSLGPRRLTNAVLGGFAALALVLAAVGIYGVMALSVGGRMKEFGIRLALGAQPGNVQRIVFAHGLVLAGLGVATGLVGALGLTRFLRSLLFGVSPVDWVTFVGGVLVLSGAALVACYLPARRATGADPISVLRTE